jgi:hypothetical protein
MCKLHGCAIGYFVGSIGSASGMSEVIVRTEEGIGLFNIVEGKSLEIVDVVNVEAINKGRQAEDQEERHLAR